MAYAPSPKHQPDPIPTHREEDEYTEDDHRALQINPSIGANLVIYGAVAKLLEMDTLGIALSLLGFAAYHNFFFNF